MYSRANPKYKPQGAHIRRGLFSEFYGTTSKIVFRHTTVDRLTEEVNDLSKEIQQYTKLVTFATKDRKNCVKLVEERK